MKNIVGYQKKGLLEILDREGTHYNPANGAPTNKPPTPIQGNKRGGVPLSSLKKGLENSTP
jgi:hypothetical protein